MTKFAIALIFASLSATAVAGTYNYSCNVCVFPTLATTNGSDECEPVGKAYPLRVDEDKNVLEWREKRY
jgi:hypothetical protein